MSKFLAALALCVLVGCSSYRLGGPRPAFTRLEIETVRNATSRVGTHAVLQQKLAESFAGDPGSGRSRWCQTGRRGRALQS